MSYNFYNNFHENTFQDAPQFLPPPPPPPGFFVPPLIPLAQNTDANFVKQFDSINTREKSKPQISISGVRDEICNLILKLKELKSKERLLSDNINVMSNEQWSSNIQQIEENKRNINSILSNLKNLNVEVLRKLLTKRSAKRARLKRLRSERKKEKVEWIKQMQERSRQIDEILQKTQDDIRKTKQEEEAKIQADIVLKETLRKKHDAKRYVVKLDALVKLRRARQNTARGRGESGSDAEAATFNNNIEKLKSLWIQRLSIYENEEADLRAKLAEDSEDVQLSAKESEQAMLDGLAGWKHALFGGVMPQADYAGDVATFVSVRSQWDEFLSSDGTSLPIGWVPPSLQFSI